MAILKQIRNRLQIIGLNTNQSIKKHPFNARNLISLFIHGINLMCSTKYLISGTENGKELVLSVFILITAVLDTSMFIHLNWNMQPLFEYINNLEDTVDQRLAIPKSKIFYAKTIEKVQKVVKIITFILPQMTPVLMFVPTFLVSFITYFTTDLGGDALELPLPKWFPFDVKTPIGYTIAVGMEFLISLNIQLLGMCIMIIAMGSSLVLLSITNDVKHSLHILNKCGKMKKNPLKIVQQFNESVEFNSKAKQLVIAFSDIMEFLFAVFFSWSTGSICFNMLTFQIELQHGSTSSELIQRGNQLIVSLALVYVCCEFGYKLSDAFEQIDDAVDQLNWYKFPLFICKELPILMACSQEPAELSVFGSISCTRETFKKIVHCGFSYFMVLRQFEYID